MIPAKSIFLVLTSFLLQLKISTWIFIGASSKLFPQISDLIYQMNPLPTSLFQSLKPLQTTLTVSLPSDFLLGLTNRGCWKETKGCKEEELGYLLTHISSVSQLNSGKGCCFLLKRLPSLCSSECCLPNESLLVPIALNSLLY